MPFSVDYDTVIVLHLTFIHVHFQVKSFNKTMCIKEELYLEKQVEL